jgi:hypothetical protein
MKDKQKRISKCQFCALTLALMGIAGVTVGCGGGSGGGSTADPTPTPTPSSLSAITRAEVVGTWKIISINAPLLTNGFPTTYNTTGTDQTCPATITNKESNIPSVGCGAGSTLTFQDDGVVVNGTNQPWLTTILNSGATDFTTGISKWTIEPGAFSDVVRVTTSNQSVIGNIILDTKRETPVGGKLRARSTMWAGGVGGYPQFLGIQLVLEKV